MGDDIFLTGFLKIFEKINMNGELKSIITPLILLLVYIITYYLRYKLKPKSKVEKEKKEEQKSKTETAKEDIKKVNKICIKCLDRHRLDMCINCFDCTSLLIRSLLTKIYRELVRKKINEIDDNVCKLDKESSETKEIRDFTNYLKGKVNPIFKEKIQDYFFKDSFLFTFNNDEEKEIYYNEVYNKTKNMFITTISDTYVKGCPYTPNLYELLNEMDEKMFKTLEFDKIIKEAFKEISKINALHKSKTYISSLFNDEFVIKEDEFKNYI